jgi:tRNA threonylcarbamoyl adenosine modification protein YeaZ
MARGHAEALMPMIAEVMDEARLDFAGLDLIAATTGPGTFTGVRIAIAAARGLALVTRAKLYGTDSLAVMARSARAACDLAADRSPSRSMPGAACFISVFTTEQAASSTALSSLRLTTPLVCCRRTS